MKRIDFPNLVSEIKRHKLFAASRAVEVLNVIENGNSKVDYRSGRVLIRDKYVEVQFANTVVVNVTFEELSINDKDWPIYLTKLKKEWVYSNKDDPENLRIKPDYENFLRNPLRNQLIKK